MYDLMKTNEDMALSIVKENLTHFKIQKITKNHMALWKLCKILIFFVSMFQLMFWVLKPN
jgi:hypothetical protein